MPLQPPDPISAAKQTTNRYINREFDKLRQAHHDLLTSLIKTPEKSTPLDPSKEFFTTMRIWLNSREKEYLDALEPEGRKAPHKEGQDPRSATPVGGDSQRHPIKDR